jgi:hypothetical protein
MNTLQDSTPNPHRPFSLMSTKSPTQMFLLGSVCQLPRLKTL